MKRKFIILFFTIILSLPVFAQLEVKEDSFQEVIGFVNINIDKMYDDNDKPYAVLKIKTENINNKQRHQLSFSTDSYSSFEVEYNIGEVWLYISHYASYINISHPEFGFVSYEFPYEMTGKHGYELTIVYVSDVIGFGSLTLNTVPENDASVTINGITISQRTPYVDNKITAGTYEITVTKDGFQSVTKTVVIEIDESVTLDIEMPYLHGTIHIESNPSGATVIIDDKEIGITPITTNDIIVGKHSLTLKKDDCLPLNEKFTLYADNTFTFNGNLEHRPIGSINGMFSVGPDTKVYFSKGNLQYKPLTDTWRFAENQWDFSLGINTQMGTEKDRWFDLFGWGTGNDPTKWNTNIANYKTFVDWGDNAISNGANVPKLWRTLSYKEWQYVKSRPNKYVRAKVNGVMGWILLPDDWNEANYKLKYGEKSANKTKNKISSKDWETRFELNGAVFLPSAGKRYGKAVIGGDFDYQNSNGPTSGNVSEGYPVRLVHQIN